MPVNLPPELLQLAEDHACFSGCWDRAEESTVVIAPGQVERVITVHCSDCLSYRLGASVTQLGPGPYSALPRELASHVHSKRGYTLSFSGYHLAGNGGFWLAAAWLAQPGVFLLRADRRSNAPDPVARLIEAFQLGVAAPPDPGMLLPRNYRSQIVHVRGSAQSLSAPTVPALLASGAVSPVRVAGSQEVTLAEFLPVTTQAATPRPTVGTTPLRTARARRAAVPPTPPPPRPRQLGDRCDVCGELVEERQLLISTYIGCACG